MDGAISPCRSQQTQTQQRGLRLGPAATAFPRAVWRLWWSFVCLPIKAVDALVLGDSVLLLPNARPSAEW